MNLPRQGFFLRREFDENKEQTNTDALIAELFFKLIKILLLIFFERGSYNSCTSKAKKSMISVNSLKQNLQASVKPWIFTLKLVGPAEIRLKQIRRN